MLLSEIIQFIKQTQKEKGKQVFPWSDDALGQYLAWAFSKDYLFLESDENGLAGLLIVYPVDKVKDMKVNELLPTDKEFSKEAENTADLVIMDGIFKTNKARKTITNKFMQRFSNWKNQKKWAMRKLMPTELNNKYIELVGGLN